MTTFLLRNHKETEFYYGTHSRGPLDIRGDWSASGMQPVKDGGVPECVAEVFRSMPQVKRIALEAEGGAGVVWQRVLVPDAQAADGAGHQGEYAARLPQAASATEQLPTLPKLPRTLG